MIIWCEKMNKNVLHLFKHPQNSYCFAYLNNLKAKLTYTHMNFDGNVTNMIIYLRI